MKDEFKKKKRCDDRFFDLQVSFLTCWNASQSSVRRRAGHDQFSNMSPGNYSERRLNDAVQQETTRSNTTSVRQQLVLRTMMKVNLEASVMDSRATSMRKACSQKGARCWAVNYECMQLKYTGLSYHSLLFIFISNSDGN